MIDEHQPETPTERRAPADDDAIRALVARLARPHRSGGRVIERASLMAEGADFTAVMAWVEAHGGEAEVPKVAKAPRGLHSPRQSTDGDTAPLPLRFIVPDAAFTAPATS
jgi:hypothetical protein